MWAEKASNRRAAEALAVKHAKYEAQNAQSAGAREFAEDKAKVAANAEVAWAVKAKERKAVEAEVLQVAITEAKKAWEIMHKWTATVKAREVAEGKARKAVQDEVNWATKVEMEAAKAFAMRKIETQEADKSSDEEESGVESKKLTT